MIVTTLAGPAAEPVGLAEAKEYLRIAKAGMAAVRGAQAVAASTIEGWRCVLLTPLFSDATRERVGLWRALLRLKAVVEKI